LLLTFFDEVIVNGQKVSLSQNSTIYTENAMNNLLLTIEGHEFITGSQQWFYYSGSLATAPVWFLDLLEDEQYIRLPTGVIHFHLMNGGYSVYPNSLVFLTRTKNHGPTLQTLQAVARSENYETLRQGIVNNYTA
jgi:hypothetical protein